MVQKILDEHANVCLVVAGLIGSALFILLGYWSAAAIGIAQTDNVGFLRAFNQVLNKPFEAYYNNYTPILTVLGFILAEFLFYLFLLYLKQQGDASDASSAVIQMDLTQPEKKVAELFEVSFDEDEVESINSDNSTTMELFEDDIIFSDNADVTDIMNEVELKDNILINKEKNISFSSDEMTILMQKYDIAQITEMKRLSTYMEGVSVNLLMKTFHPSMSAKEIKECIDIFYGNEEV